MQRRYRLRRSSEFEHARTKGKAWSHPLLTVFLHARDDLDPSRVGIVVSKRTGKATIRNRVKRRIREAARALYPLLPLGHDVVVIAKRVAAEASAKGLLDALEAVLHRAGAQTSSGADGGSSMGTSIPMAEEG